MDRVVLLRSGAEGRDTYSYYLIYYQVFNSNTKENNIYKKMHVTTYFLPLCPGK